MKRFLMIATMAAALGIVAVPKAEAAINVTMVVCQTGFGCLNVPDLVADPANFTNVDIVWGDYHITNLSGLGQEGTSLSSGSQTELGVHRRTATNAGALEVYLVAAGFMLPTGPSYLLDTSLASTNTTGTGDILFQGWFSGTNSTTIPPTGQTNGQIQCFPTGGPGSCSLNGTGVTVTGGLPFSLIGRVSFLIPTTELENLNNPALFSYNATGVVQVSAVPEPGTMVLLGTGLIGLAAGIRRRMAK